MFQLINVGKRISKLLNAYADYQHNIGFSTSIVVQQKLKDHKVLHP
jgi:hypothetical protein